MVCFGSHDRRDDGSVAKEAALAVQSIPAYVEAGACMVQTLQKRLQVHISYLRWYMQKYT